MEETFTIHTLNQCNKCYDCGKNLFCMFITSEHNEEFTQFFKHNMLISQISTS